MVYEANLDALVGPTHHFGGLGVGNLASQAHARQTSFPRAAALEGLRKAAVVARLGVPQFVLLPPPRPQLALLQQLGFGVESESQLREAWLAAPRAFSAACSSAFMWAANAATVSPACDTLDGRLHITPANLISSWHRGIEAQERMADLQELTRQLAASSVHPPLPAIVPLRDEGAANHMRLCDPSGRSGVHVFVYGADDAYTTAAPRFLPRQTRAACEAISRRHQLPPDRAFFLQQHPQAISAGVFHNDVIATSHHHLWLHHELAYLDAEADLQRLEDTFQRVAGRSLQRIIIDSSALPLEDAVQSYFFNSQIVSPAADASSRSAPRMVIVCPQQCHDIPSARRVVEWLVAAADNPIDDVHYVPLQQSMANGGGPACLRLRLPVEAGELPRLAQHLRLDARLEERLSQVIERCYPQQLDLGQLCDPEAIANLQHISHRLRQAVFV